jgi:hypothetical protein
MVEEPMVPEEEGVAEGAVPSEDAAEPDPDGLVPPPDP